MKKRILSLLLVFSIIFILLPIKGFAAPGDVSTFKEFKAALEDPDITLVNIIAPFTMEKDTITINPKKSGLVINGNFNQITQVDSSSAAYSIQFDSAKSNIQTITIQNLIIAGLSRKGFVYIPTCSKYSNFTVNFNKIIYTGPELIKAKYSNINITDSDILIQPGHCDSTGYLVEGMNITLSGIVTIDKQAPKSNRSLFYVNSKGSLVIANSAIVNIHNNTFDDKVSKKSGFAYFSSCSTKLLFGSNSKFNYEGVSTFAYGCDIDEVIVGDYAEVIVMISGNLSTCDGLLAVKSLMEVRNSATLELIAVNNTNCYPVIEFGNKSVFSVDAPIDILFYNASAKNACYGMAIDNACTMTINYSNVTEVGYWVKNTTPYFALGNPTYAFTSGGNMYSAILGMSCGKVKTVNTPNYTGSTPLTSAAFKDVNVIHIKGAPET